MKCPLINQCDGPDWAYCIEILMDDMPIKEVIQMVKDHCFEVKGTWAKELAEMRKEKVTE